MAGEERRLGRRIGKTAAILQKRVRRLLARPVESVPVFVFGKQRSGTTMLMDVFHARHDTEVFDERRDSEAFADYRVRGLDVVAQLVARSKAPFVCFKPLADSHLIREFDRRFPTARMIWAYRHYLGAALSSLRKFGHATRAIRLVCTGQPGGGWFAEGLSADTVQTLRAVYRPTLSAVDFLCLVWWARNRLVFELELGSLPNVYLSKYEDLIADRERAFAALFTFIGMSYDEGAIRTVSRVGPGRTVVEPLDPDVQRLCEELLARLDARHSYSTGTRT